MISNQFSMISIDFDLIFNDFSKFLPVGVRRYSKLFQIFDFSYEKCILLMICHVFYVFLIFSYVFLSIFIDLGDGGRIFLEDPTPINPRRDNISRKDNPSLRLYIYIYYK